MFRYKKSNISFKKCAKWIIGYLKYFAGNYLRHTSLHGCRYIIERKEHGIFSVVWAIVFLISLVFCILLIFTQLKRFQDSAILNSIASTGFPVWKIPFPAVVICNNNLVYKSKAESIKGMMTNRGFEEKEIDQFFEHLSSLVVCQNCDENAILYNNTVDIKIYSYLEELNYDINNLMVELAHPCGKMIKKCYWKSDEMSCSRLFRRIKTTLGYCCAFNYFGTIDVQYEDYNQQFQYAGGFGLGSGLQVIVDIEPLEYVSSVKTTTGIEIIVGDVFQFAEMGLYSHSLTGGQILNMGLYPTIYGSSEDLKHISDKSRGCWFNDEGSPRWSKTYNTLTCFNECKAAFIYEICKCVPFYYSFTGARRVCTMRDLSCILSNESKFTQVMISNNIDEDSEFIEEHKISPEKLCYCLPSCEEVQYEVDKNIKEVKDTNNTCTINIHFNTITGTYMIRNIHVTWDILLATIGGVFGLCMGGSILSLVELIFFIIDACLKVRSPRNTEKKNANKVKKITFITRTYPVELKDHFIN